MDTSFWWQVLIPSGLPSDFNSYADSVTIAAPADKDMRSYNFLGEAKSFGGTSAAAPLVTGTLGGFTLLSGYHLNTGEIKHLLEKTAVPLPYLSRSHLLGSGMLNSYKMGKVALRLKQRCREHGQKMECMESLLETESIYHFAEESAALFDRGIEAFPDCDSNERVRKVQKNSCGRQTAFHNLRRAALLNPADAKFWKAMACVKEKHFQGGGEFYQSLAEGFGKSDEEIIGEICTETGKHYVATYLEESLLDKLIDRDSCHPDALASAALTLSHRGLISHDKIDSIFQKVFGDERTHHLTLSELIMVMRNSFGEMPSAPRIFKSDHWP